MLALVFLLAQTAGVQGIENLHQREVAATKAFDVQAIAALWTDDYVALPPSAEPILGKSANVDVLQRTKDNAANSQVEIVDYSQKWDEVTVGGDYAYEWGTFKSTARRKTDNVTQTAEFKVIRVLKRQADGNWKIARAMWNEIPPPSPPPPAAPKPQ